jgi:hypothetical protein
MTDSGTPIQSQTARFLVGGAKRGEGYLLLYPDNLTAVISSVETWGYLVVPLIFLAITIPLFHTIGWLGVAVGSVIGRQAGEAINKRRAIKKVTAGGDGVTVIPLDLLTGVQTRKPEGLAGRWGARILVVTTADRAEYEFRGTMEKWQGYLAGALTARGREVYAVHDAITVMPQVMSEEG